MASDVWLRLEKSPDLFDAIPAESGDNLAIQKRLRAHFEPDLVRLALTLTELRAKAEAKFDRANAMWFDSIRLEQATSQRVAEHKAQRFNGEVVDLCCGLGADAIALARSSSVTAIDIDGDCEFFTSRNAAVYGVSERVTFCRADATSFATTALIHIDPDRRAGGTRVRRLEQYEPGLEFLQQMAATARGGAIKVSAASNFGGKFADCEIELVSLAGECKEATVWFGELAGPQPWRATHLPSGESITGDPLDAVADISPPLEYLCDPDPALVRSGLLDVFATQHRLARLDDAEEYLTGDSRPASNFVTTFAVVDQTTNNDKQIRRMLKAHQIGPLEAKTRHIKADANALQRKFAKPEGKPGVLFIARLEGKARAILCERLASH